MNLPNDLDAEEQVVGALLATTWAAPLVVGKLASEDFYSPEYRRLYGYVSDLYTNGHGADIVTVRDHAARAGETVDLLRLQRIVEDTLAIDVATVRKHASIVTDLARRRRLVAAGYRLSEAAGMLDRDVDDLASGLLNELAVVEDQDVFEIAELANQGLEGFEAASQSPDTVGIRSGYPDIDRLVGGMRGGRVLVVAARPGVGKTSWALNVLLHVAKGGRCVVMFSLEMSSYELGIRLLALEGSVNAAQVQAGTLPEHEVPRLLGAAGTLSELDAVVMDKQGLSIDELRILSRRMVSARSVDLLIVDYLQLMTGTRHRDGRQVEVAEISRGLKTIAKELDVPVIAVCQLNREVEHRKDKRPMLSDLRESGAIENDADAVLLMYADEDDTNTVHFDVAKNRHGPTGSARLTWLPHLMAFRSQARREWAPPPYGL
jgi:replicative DNA helicase